MFTVADVKQEYRRLDQLTGAQVASLPIEISGRMTRTLGQYRFQGTKPLKIVLSRRVMELGEAQREDFLSVIRHEYAHAMLHGLEPHVRHGHDQAFRSLCAQLGCQSGARIAVALPVCARYLVRCAHCGQTYPYQRMCPTVREIARGAGERYRCRVCGSAQLSVVTAPAPQKP